MNKPVETFEAFADDAAHFLGDKVIEIADRLAVADKVVPGTQATYSFECDGVIYKIAMTVTSRIGR